MPTGNLPPYNTDNFIAGGRAAAAGKIIAKRVSEIYSRLNSQLDALDRASADVLRADVPATAAVALARPLWSLRHETLQQARQAAEAAIAHIDAQIAIVDDIIGDYAPTYPAGHPRAGEPLDPGWTPLPLPPSSGE